jgi:hypothetical protein
MLTGGARKNATHLARTLALTTFRALIVAAPLPAAMTTAALAAVMIRPVGDETMPVDTREQLVVRAARNDKRTKK